MPVIQLIILSNAATFDVKNIKFSFIDNDKSIQSRALIDKFRATEYFVINNFNNLQLLIDIKVF